MTETERETDKFAKYVERDSQTDIYMYIIYIQTERQREKERGVKFECKIEVETVFVIKNVST